MDWAMRPETGKETEIRRSLRKTEMSNRLSKRDNRLSNETDRKMSNRLSDVTVD